MELVIFSVVHRDKISLGVADIVLSWPVDVIFRVVQKFNPMGNPSSNSWNCKENWVHVSGETHSPVDETTVEIYIRIEFSRDKVLIFKSYLL